MNLGERRKLARQRDSALDAATDKRRSEAQAFEDSLVKLDEILAGAKPKKQEASGIYFLLRYGRVVYVGQSRWVHARLCAHISEDKKDFDSYFIQLCERSELTKLESIYINRFLPKYNRQPVYDRGQTTVRPESGTSI